MDLAVLQSLQRATVLTRAMSLVLVRRALGDVEGHEFHGNQYTDGGVSLTEHEAALQKQLVDFKLDRKLTGPDSQSIQEAIPGAKFSHYIKVPGIDKMHDAMGVNPLTSTDPHEYQAARNALFNTLPEQQVPFDQLTFTQPRVNKPQYEGLSKTPQYFEKPVQMIKHGDNYYLMNGHHRVVAAYAAGRKTVAAKVLDTTSSDTGRHKALGEEAGHEFHGNQWTGNVGQHLDIHSKSLEPAERALFGEDSPETYAKLMFQSLPKDTEVIIQSSPGSSDEQPQALMVVDSKDADLMRTFTREGNQLVVDHSVFDVSERAQGKGIAKTVLSDSMNAYEMMGVDRVDVNAQDVGSYAWARFGFKARDPELFANRMVHVVKERLPESQQAAVRKLIVQHWRDPELPWHIAALRNGSENIGKKLLVDVPWLGSLDLHDKNAMARFDHYTGRQ